MGHLADEVTATNAKSKNPTLRYAQDGAPTQLRAAVGYFAMGAATDLGVLR